MMQTARIYDTDLDFFRALYIHQAGEETCEKGHSFGPAVRDHFLVHIVLEGKGIFQCNGKSYEIGKGQGFLIFPDLVTYYAADWTDPWHYCWIGFNGLEADQIVRHCRISREQPVFEIEDYQRGADCIRSVQEFVQPESNLLYRQSRLYEFFSLIEGHDAVRYSEKRLARMTAAYISKNFSYPVSVSQIADSMMTDRSHLFRVFKAQYGKSVQEYLQEYRLTQAVELMKDHDMTITEIMYSCGFQDLPNFSRQFKKRYGESPRGFYKKLQQEQQ
ncbi:AraC family transcriptional regulator [Anaerobium acetethylicum]|uniref:AraC-type DNA-binding protein n=1 Tax=Anaerobium acetethylicum TaxID=1619234 RepID=A0A1D3TYV4_9FIRM|nr:AraC family transcriptional regulator [Anaerobium acetethylicum]SCP99667.1 AraC-type DNA-binding protein [Anaerobium acetethylicum]